VGKDSFKCESAVVIATDFQYSNYAEILTKKLISETTIPEIYVLIDGDLSRFVKINNIQKLEKRVTVIDVSHAISQINSQSTRFPNISYARIFLEEILPQHISKVLYLDVDTDIIRNIDFVFGIQFDTPLAAVINSYTWDSPDTNGEIATFNSGVLLLDLEIWRSEKISSQIRKRLKEAPSLLDQELLNSFFMNQWTPLPISLNFLATKEEIRRFMKTELKPAIVHFVGVKPWDGGSTCFHAKWRKQNRALCGNNRRLRDSFILKDLPFSGATGPARVYFALPFFIRSKIYWVRSQYRNLSKLIRQTKRTRLENLLDHIKNFDVHEILEIGVWRGDTADLLLTEAVKHSKNVKYSGVDLFFNLMTDNELQKEASLWPDSRENVYKRLSSKFHNVKIELFEGFSHDVLPSLEGRKYDLIFIDGGHSFETVKHDWECARKLLKPNGYVFFDDYTNPDAEIHEGFGVRRFVDSLDPNVFEIEHLNPIDKFEKQWGTLETQLVRVKVITG
jgi:lipopolysaccharide biosynthesis glycosyltransferase